MDRTEAQAILRDQVAGFRAYGHHGLRRWIGWPIIGEAVGDSDTSYQVEIQVFWDSREGGDLRVLGSIDDGGWRAFFFSLTTDFILFPDGTFVDE